MRHKLKLLPLIIAILMGQGCASLQQPLPPAPYGMSRDADGIPISTYKRPASMTPYKANMRYLQKLLELELQK